MKRIGIIGGMSYKSTLHYYEAINRQVNERAGGLTSADLVLRSVNFEKYYTLMEKGDWETIGSMLQEEAANLVIYNECDYVAIATNTMHKVADKVSGIYVSVPIRLVHIGDCIGEKCKEIDAKRVLLLGIRFIMTQKFIKKYLSGRYGIEAMGVWQFPREVDMRSVNFEKYYTLMEKGDWETIGSMLQEEAANLVIYNECDYAAIATNTMHKVADKVSGIYVSVPIRLVHIGDCIGEKCKEIDAKRVLLLGTRFTMTQKFMKKHLSGRYGIEVMGVRQFSREVDIIDHIIFDELCCGIVTPRSKEFIKDFVTKFTSGEAAHGFKPDAVILGCTELNMILQPEDVCVPLIDSTQVHIDKLVDLCLEE